MKSLKEVLVGFRMPLVVSGVVLLAMLVLAAWAWQMLPEGVRIPIHWNSAGEVDGYGGKFMALLMMPIALVGIALLFSVLPFIEPRKKNLLLSSKAFGACWIGTVLVLAGLQAAVVANALGKPINVSFVTGLATGLLFILMGNYLGKLRSNFFVGIRTPWTLSSELSWGKTHRLGGRLFVLFGLVLAIGTLVKGSEILPLLAPALLTLVVALAGYSYLVWRNDPNKHALGR